MADLLPLTVAGLRFHMRVRRSVHFPEAKAANILRSALGVAMKRVHCSTFPENGCQTVESCPHAQSCLYSKIFAPRAPENWPSGFQDLPRPFVLRASHLNGTTFPPASTFDFDLYLLSTLPSVYRALGSALASLSSSPFGPGDGAILLARVDNLGEDQQPALPFDGKNLIKIDLALHGNTGKYTTEKLQIRFLSPIDLRTKGRTIHEPDFKILFARLRERLLMLSRLYHKGEFGVGEDLLNLASEVRLIHWSGESQSVQRHSRTQDRAHDIGGITGTATYEGPIQPFLPWLKSAQWTGLGKHAVWGNGQIVCQIQE